MNVEVKRLPESRVTVSVELSPGEVEQALDRTYRQLVQRLNIPGFRKGKAPRAVVERAVGADVFLHEATEEAVRWGYRKAIEQANLTPIDEAEIDPGEGHDHISPGQPFAFDATVAVRPEVQLPDYHAIKLERPVVQVDQADVDELLEELRERTATLEPVSRPAQMGDVVTMNMTARVDGQEVLNQENMDFELRDEEQEEASSSFPGLSAQLVGTSPGEIREPILQLPDTYFNQAWAGKSMILRALIKEVKRKVLPALDDEFAESVSQFQTLPELREALEANLTMERKLEADEKLVSEAVDAVTSRAAVDIPPILVEDELDRLMQDLRRNFETRRMSFETYLEVSGQTEDAIRAELRDQAVQNVRASLVLSALADAENIEVSNRDLDQALDEALRNLRTSDAERRRLRTSTGVRTGLRNRLRRQRAIQRLVEIVSGGEEVSPEATAAVTDQTAAPAGDTEETVAVEIGS